MASRSDALSLRTRAPTSVTTSTGGRREHLGTQPLAGDERELEGAELERSLSVAAVAVIALLLGAAVFVHNRWAALLALPALLFPAVFLGDNVYPAGDPTRLSATVFEPFEGHIQLSRFQWDEDSHTLDLDSEQPDAFDARSN